MAASATSQFLSPILPSIGGVVVAPGAALPACTATPGGQAVGNGLSSNEGQGAGSRLACGPRDGYQHCDASALLLNLSNPASRRVPKISLDADPVYLEKRARTTTSTAEKVTCLVQAAELHVAAGKSHLASVDYYRAALAETANDQKNCLAFLAVEHSLIAATPDKASEYYGTLRQKLRRDDASVFSAQVLELFLYAAEGWISQQQFAQAAAAYRIASTIEEHREQKSTLALTSAHCCLEQGMDADAARMYRQALADANDADKSQLQEHIRRRLQNRAEALVAEGNDPALARALQSIAEFSDTHEERLRHYTAAAQAYAEQGAFNDAGSCMVEALRLTGEQSGADSELRDRAIVLTILGGSFQEAVQLARARYPELASALAEIVEGSRAQDLKTRNGALQDTAFLRKLPQTLPLIRIFQALVFFQRMRSEIGISPARETSTIALVIEGVEKWMQNDFASPETIPDWFVFPGLAMTTSEEESRLLARLLSIKEMRHSKDKRKTVLWYGEDHRAEPQAMRDLFQTIRYSSAGKMIDLIGLLPIARMLESRFAVDDVCAEHQLRDTIYRVLARFSEARIANPVVRARFEQRVDELNASGLLRSLLEIYDRYRHFPALIPLVDIALAAEVMGDFEQVKFPTREGVNGLSYLNDDQRRILLAMCDTSAIDVATMAAWKEDLQETVPTQQAAKAANVLDQEYASRIKAAAETIARELQVSGVADVAFTQEYLQRVRLDVERTVNGSFEFKRLKQIERIVASIETLHGVTVSALRNGDSRVAQALSDLTSSLKGFFGLVFGPGSVEAMGVETRVGVPHLKALVSEAKQTLARRSLEAVESADFALLLQSGKFPENSKACLKTDSSPHSAVALSSYLLNSSIKMICVRDNDGVIVGRAMLKLVPVQGRTHIFLENPYYRNGKRDDETKAAIIALAKKKARAMNLPLISPWLDDKDGARDTVEVQFYQGLSPYEYSDLDNGIGRIIRAGTGPVKIHVIVWRDGEVS